MTKIYTRGWPIKEWLEFYGAKIPSGCIEWTGPRTSTGYGRIKIDYINRGAHRVAWEEHRGPIPFGMHVLHKCDNPSCINPDHLFLGTHQENMTDKVRKKRQARGAGHSEAVKAVIPRGEARSIATLTNEKVFEMRWRRALGEKVGPLAREFGVSRTTASNAINNVTYKFEAHD